MTSTLQQLSFVGWFSLVAMDCALCGAADPPASPPAKKEAPAEVACEACDSVGVEILEGVSYLKWDFVSPPPSEFYLERSFALAGVPKRFLAQRPAESREGLVVRAMASVVVQPGEHRLLVRSIGPARLFVDDYLIAEVKAPAEGDPKAAKPEPAEPGLAPLPAGQWEKVVKVRLSPRPRSETPNAHTFKLVAFVPRDGREAPEWCVAIAGAGESFRLLSPKQNTPLTAEGWKAAAAASRKALEEVEREHEARQRDGAK
jgi:hypothetical protein